MRPAEGVDRLYGHGAGRVGERAHVTSSATFEVELDSGERFIGTFQTTPQPGRLSVVGDTGTTVHDLQTVVRVTPMRGGWWGRFDGSLDVGFSFTKANEAR